VVEILEALEVREEVQVEAQPTREEELALEG